MKDLVVMVADKNAQFALKGVLNRPEAMGTRRIQFEFRVHPGRDGGVRKSGPEMLALERSRFTHGLLVLDFEGSGTSLANAIDLEAELDARLQPRWSDQAKAVVIEPEVDVWMWGSDNVLRDSFHWEGPRRIRDWLRDRGYQFNDGEKPERPKEALEAVLRHCKLPRSSALYQEIASKVSLPRCVDPAFQRLRSRLAQWFPLECVLTMMDIRHQSEGRGNCPPAL
jgi:hypothetical protein